MKVLTKSLLFKFIFVIIIQVQIFFVLINNNASADLGKISCENYKNCKESTLSLEMSRLGLADSSKNSSFNFYNVKSIKIFDNNKKLINAFYDRNNDGIIDHKIFYKDGLLQSEEEDRNYDKLIDKITIETFNQKEGELLKIIKLDNDYDGIFELVQEYYKDLKDSRNINVKSKKYINGKYILVDELVVKNGSEASEAKTNSTTTSLTPLTCERSLSILDILSSTREDVISRLVEPISTSPFYMTSVGVQIDKSCVSKLNTSTNKMLPKVIVETLQEGISCLKGLAKYKPTSSSSSSSSNLVPANGAAENIVKLVNLLSNGLDTSIPLSYICSEQTGYDWDSIKAHASYCSSVKAEITLLDRNKVIVNHPLISLNPKTGNSGPPLEAIDELNFKGNFFHELFHNIGYLHNKDIEYPYACQRCCIEKEKNSDDKPKSINDAKEATKAACRICAGNYAKGIDDPDYINDLIMFYTLAGDSRFPDMLKDQLANYLRKNPTDYKAFLAMKELMNADQSASEAGKNFKLAILASFALESKTPAVSNMDKVQFESFLESQGKELKKVLPLMLEFENIDKKYKGGQSSEAIKMILALDLTKILPSKKQNLKELELGKIFREKAAKILLNIRDPSSNETTNGKLTLIWVSIEHSYTIKDKLQKDIDNLTEKEKESKRPAIEADMKAITKIEKRVEDLKEGIKDKKLTLKVVTELFNA
ncbi:MAG: hypothetical protein HQK51_14185, partial [Oligoflexia bacterium]|nr:hypothetical protein [Oligoflexia bacterium]